MVPVLTVRLDRAIKRAHKPTRVMRKYEVSKDTRERWIVLPQYDTYRPSKQGALSQRRFNGGPPPVTLAEH